MTAAITWLASALLPIVVWPILRGLFYGLRSVFSFFSNKFVPAGVGLALGGFSKWFPKWFFGATFLNFAGIIMFFSGLKFLRYAFSVAAGILGYGAIYYLFFDAFIERVYSLVVEQLLGFPPEIIVWLNYFGVVDGLRLFQAVFIWIAGFKLLMYILKPPTSLL